MDAAERLATIDLWVCPRPLRAQRAALRALTQAVIRSEPSITPTSASRTDEREVDGYSWVSNGESFLLRTDAVWIGDTWIGNFKLGRCRSEAVTDTWRVDGGSTVAVIRADVERGTTARELWFDYVSTCVFEDRACHNRELDRLWPTLRSVAGRHEATAIHIAAENCVGTSVSFSLDRTPDEQWKGGLWSPPRK